MRYFRWILLALIILPAWLLATAPASLVAQVAAASGLQLSGVEGSLWQGSANSARLQLAASKGRPQVFDLGEVHWTLEPMRLLALQVCARVGADLRSQQFKARICTGPGGELAISDLRANLPASYVGLMAPLQANGQMMLALDELALQGDQLTRLSGSGQLQNFSLLMGRDWQSFGNLSLNLGVAGDKTPLFTADIISEDKAIQWFASAPSVTLTPVGPDMLVTNQLQLSESYRQSWSNMLSIVGFEERDGGYFMEIKLP